MSDMCKNHKDIVTSLSSSVKCLCTTQWKKWFLLLPYSKKSTVGWCNFLHAVKFLNTRMNSCGPGMDVSTAGVFSPRLAAELCDPSKRLSGRG